MENDIKHSIEYINKKVGKKPGFSAPSDYFDTLEDVIVTKISEENFTKENNFKVPDDYFNNLEDSIFSKINTVTEKKETKVISLKSKLFKLIPIAAAASIILFIGLNSFVFNTDNDKITIDTLSDDDVEYWIESNTLSTSDVALVLENDILQEHDFSFSTIKDESIEDYIVNNSIENDIDFLNDFD